MKMDKHKIPSSAVTIKYFKSNRQGSVIMFIFRDTGAIALADSKYLYTVSGQLQLGGLMWPAVIRDMSTPHCWRAKGTLLPEQQHCTSTGCSTTLHRATTSTCWNSPWCTHPSQNLFCQLWLNGPQHFNPCFLHPSTHSQLGSWWTSQWTGRCCH